MSGMQLSVEGPRTVVKSVFAGMPAAMSGLQAGDVVVRVNGEGIEKHTLFTIQRLLEQSRSVVTFTIERRNRTLDTRLKLPSISRAEQAVVPSEARRGSSRS